MVSSSRASTGTGSRCRTRLSRGRRFFPFLPSIWRHQLIAANKLARSSPVSIGSGIRGRSSGGLQRLLRTGIERKCRESRRRWGLRVGIRTIRVSRGKDKRRIRQWRHRQATIGFGVARSVEVLKPRPGLRGKRNRSHRCCAKEEKKSQKNDKKPRSKRSRWTDLQTDRLPEGESLKNLEVVLEATGAGHLNLPHQAERTRGVVGRREEGKGTDGHDEGQRAEGRGGEVGEFVKGKG